MKNNMKIRIEVSSLASTHISGVGYYTQRLTDALAKHSGVTVRASYYNFLGRQPKPVFDKKVIIEQHRFIPLRVYAKLQSHKFIFPFDFLSKRVALTILPNYARWPTLRSSFTATTIHDLTYLRYPELMEKNNLPHLQRVVPRAVKKSNLILTVSEAVKSELVQEFSIDPNKIIVTPVPPNDRFYDSNQNEVHTKYGIPTQKYILFLSNIEPRKNVPVLIEAFTKLPKSVTKDLSLVIAGGLGWKSESSVKAIKKAVKLGFSVVQPGYIDESDKSALYQQAALFVMPSIYEGFGMPILEAIASNTPVIASDIPVLREAGGDGILYFKPGDSLSLQESITLLIDDPVLQKRLMKKARNHLKSFSWEKNAQSIVDAVNRLSV